MNDFTKEELELTLDLYQEFMKKYEFSEDVEAITSKIQSLIDSYCEHKEVVTGAYPRSNPPKKCDSCGVLYYENQ